MKGCSHTKNEFDKRQDCLVQKFGLRRFQRLDAIHDFNFSEKKTKGGSVRRLRWTGIRADEVIFGKEISTTKRQMFF